MKLSVPADPSNKIPFPLTQMFRSMLQNGIDMSTIDVGHASGTSSICLDYGICLVLFWEKKMLHDTQRMMQLSSFGFDPSKSLSAERDNLDIVQHDWALPKFDQRAKAILRKLLVKE